MNFQIEVHLVSYSQKILIKAVEDFNFDCKANIPVE